MKIQFDCRNLLIFYLILSSFSLTKQQLHEKQSQNFNWKELLSPSCLFCKLIVKGISFMPKDLVTKYVESILIKECPKLENYNEQVCKGAIKEMGTYIVDSISAHYLSHDFICGELFKKCPATYKILNANDYIEEITKNTLNKSLPIPSQKQKYRILQISDTHVDLNYTIGSNSQCDYPLCCRTESGMAKEPYQGAGKWGTASNCDLPLNTFIGFAKYAKKYLEFDFMIWTGDFKAHNVWDDTKQQAIQTTQICTQILQKELQNIIVFPTIGNHEAHPVNVFTFLNRTYENWLIQPLAQYWQQWLGVESTNQFLKWGYYSYNIKEKNLKIISLHQQACNNLNWFLLQDPSDPGNMLDWLHHELQDSENINQEVFIIGHIPGNSCLDEWSVRYSALIERYQYTVRGQFFGHVHPNKFYISRARSKINKNQTIGVTFLSGSLTTESNQFPQFRIYEIDSETNIPINYQQYYLNLTKVNSMPNVTVEDVPFELEYDFQQEYGYTDLSLATMTDFAEQLKTNEVLLKKYLKFQEAQSPMSLNKANKAKLTKEGLQAYCNTYNVNADQLQCLNEKYTGMDLFFNFVSGPWRQKIEQR